MPPIDPALGAVLYDSARDAYEQGQSLWSCMVVVAVYGGAIRGLGAVPTIRQWSPDELLHAIEQLGWRLEHVDHVYVEQEYISGVSGGTEAHYTFRRI